jgi:hypothetical protein
MRNLFRRRRREPTHDEAISSLRDQMRGFGWPVDRMTDKEIAAAVVGLSKAVRSAGIPMRQAGVRMTDAMRELNASFAETARARQAQMREIARAAGSAETLAARLRETR